MRRLKRGLTLLAERPRHARNTGGVFTIAKSITRTKDQPPNLPT